jgi:polyribonucleotide nucleotidyltransferase
MSDKVTTQVIDLGDGRSISIETGRLARQADGAIILTCGKTMLMATVVAAPSAAPGVDFMPLTVDYREKFSAAGRFPGGFLKRESRPSDAEILVSRLIDRALRPLFPSDFHAETQVLISLISIDPEVQPDSLAGLAASAALAVSDVPFGGPISEVRVAKINGELRINPGVTEMAEGDVTIDMIVAGTAKDVGMVEGEMAEVSENEMAEAIQFAHQAIIKQCEAQNELAAKVGSLTKREYSHEEHDLELKERIHNACYQGCYDVAKQGNPSKKERKEAFNAVKESFVASLSEEEAAEKAGLIGWYFHDVEKEAVRRCILDERIRLDGRAMNQVRPIWSEVDYIPSAHGSAIFTRGETQSLTTVTLGTSRDAQMIDGAFHAGSENFILHYNFPPFSTGEARFLRGPGRREIGHGNLALRALKPVIPADCPYTIRVVSDILESNGSSSMATVCAGALALMDAGIKVTSPVTGIAMGMITDDQGKYAILSDILGDEDHLGDMDFKVTGTRKGITACQMDLKIDGLSYEVLAEALNQAKEGRLHIMDEIEKTLKAPREDYKDHAPRIETYEIPKEMIGAVIGPGGKIIQEIQESTGATLVIEEIDGKGVVEIAATSGESMKAALNRVKAIVAVPEKGEIYEGKVKSIVNFGAFVEVLPGKDGLLHISEIEHRRLEKVEDALKEGEIVKVQVIDIDPKTGKLKLSRKVLLPKPERKTQEEPQNQA